MVAVDTSVWVAALRNGSSTEASELQALIDRDEVLLPVPVRVEILSGARASDRSRLATDLSALPLALPTRSTWTLMETWALAGSAAGHRFGVADMLIGALAAEFPAPVWSLDRDFERMARLGWVEIYPDSN